MSVRSLDGADDPVTFALYRLQNVRRLWIVAQNIPKLSNGGIDSVLHINEHLRGPEVLSDFVARDELSLPGGKQDEQFHRLSLDPDRVTVAEEFKGTAVEPKVTEFIDRRGHLGDRLRRGTRISVAGKWLL
jgi:hypothetical protein